MSTKFKTVITTAGAAKLAAATAPEGGRSTLPRWPSGMAVVNSVPDAGQTGLIHEVWRHALNKISRQTKQ
ncbi:hypothetical protein ECZU31_17970 [Escherichia coli]|nr:phage tail protein [Escherichia coli]GHL58522.1 hypothetical protein ECZU31_17970 [Escherichia coli]